MANAYTNTECALYGSRYCDMLHMESCESCTVRKDAGRAEQLKSELDVTASLMPEQGIHGLFDTDTCMLCKGEPGKQAWYADADIANPEPRHEQRNVIGIKTVARTGSLVPLQIACCKDCRRRILRIEYLPTCLVLGVCALMLLLLSIRPLRESLMAVAMMLPFLLFVGAAAIAGVAAFFLRKRLIADAEDKTWLRLFEIPALAGMRERDWFELNVGKGGISRYVFAKKRLPQGLYTGVPGEVLQQQNTDA